MFFCSVPITTYEVFKIEVCIKDRMVKKQVNRASHVVRIFPVVSMDFIYCFFHTLCQSINSFWNCIRAFLTLLPLLILMHVCLNNLISSPELKAQVSFSDHNLSVVRRRYPRRCCRCSCCEHFTFSSSSPEPLSQFQLNLTQSILGWWGFNFVQLKGHVLFKGEIITN